MEEFLHRQDRPLATGLSSVDYRFFEVAFGANALFMCSFGASPDFGASRENSCHFKVFSSLEGQKYISR
jgi:hypothetical protein